MHIVPIASLLVAAALAAPLATPLAAQQDRDQPVQGGGTLPAGWSARTDDRAGLKDVRMQPTGDGFDLALGPAVVLWQPGDRANGAFHTLATFVQNKAPRHPEGYGLFVGGQALDGRGQKYTYFLVRGDGTYLIKRREGDRTSEIRPWTAHRAVHKANAAGVASNLLEIDAKRDPSRVVFKVNGQEVFAADAKTMDLRGLVGIRANHNLDLTVSGFGLHQ